MARNQFASKFGTMAAIAGSAVGLGNIWRFPYVAGNNGGAAFLIIYIVICLLISVPVMLSEFVIGRKGQGNTYRSFINASGKKGWGAVGAIEIFAGLVILAFYCVVAGWSLEYIFLSCSGQLQSIPGMDIYQQIAQMGVRFDQFVTLGGTYIWGIPRPVFWTILFLAFNCVVLAFGVSKGIERCSKFMIPALFCILLVLACFSIRLDGFEAGAAFLLKPNWSAVTGQTIMDALGQSFFSLSLGMAAMTTYGSYIQKEQSLVSVSLIVTLATVLMAVLAGLAIFPSTFTYGVEVTSGPGLVFKTLPALFASMPGGPWVGRIFSILFFILLFFAAITSSFSLLEAGTAYITEEWHSKAKENMSRPVALVILFVIVGSLSILCALSQMDGSHLYIMGYSLFDFSDKLTSNIILPLGGIAACILVGQLMKRDVVYNELTSDGQFNATIVKFFCWLARFVCPIVIFYMFIAGLRPAQAAAPAVENQATVINALPTEAIDPCCTAECNRANIIIMHTPGNELFNGVIHPEAGLFQDYFDVNQATAEHQAYIDLLRHCNCQVYTLRDILLSMNTDSLRALTMRSLTYVPEDESYKRSVVKQMSPEDMIRCILMRPTVTLTPTDKNTGVEAVYTSNPLTNLFFLHDQSITTPRGVIMGKMNSLQRADEVNLVSHCYESVGIKPVYAIQGDSAFLEGGDYIPFGNISIIGCGMRTNMNAISQLFNNDCFGHDTVVVVRDQMLRQDQKHLDSYFNVIDRDLVTMVQNRYMAKEEDSPNADLKHTTFVIQSQLAPLYAGMLVREIK